MGTATPRKLREGIGRALREAMSAQKVEQFCAARRRCGRALGRSGR